MEWVAYQECIDRAYFGYNITHDATTTLHCCLQNYGVNQRTSLGLFLCLILWCEKSTSSIQEEKCRRIIFNLIQRCSIDTSCNL